MFLNFITRILDKRLDQIWFTLHPPLRLVNQRFQFRKVIAGCIRQLRQLQIAPDPFRGIEVGSISRQLLQVDALGSTVRQIGFDFLGTMRRDAIPNHEQQARDHALQLSEKGDHFRTGDRMVIRFQEQAPLRGDGSDE